MTRKNIIITGASSGLGKGLALEFAKLGRNLALCARRIENLEQLKKDILDINPDLHVFLRPLDVNDSEKVFEVFKAFREDFKGIGGDVDRVIVNAGIGKGASLGTGYAKQNMQTATTNFTAALTQFEAALEIFREQNHGHLVAMSSMSAFRGYRGAITVYAATKAGLASMAEGVRVDVLKTPIKVTTLFPGYIQTEMNEHIGKKLPFLIPLEKGAKLLVDAIEKEKAKAYIPHWPWYYLKLIMPFMSMKTLRKMG